MPENVHLKGKKDTKDLKELTNQELQVQNVTTANNSDIWLRNAQEIKHKNNVTFAIKSVIFPKLVLKEDKTEEKLLNATNVMNKDI